MSNLVTIRSERAKIALQVAALQKRDSDLAIAEKVLAEFEGAATPPVAMADAPAMRRAGTRRDRIIEALENGDLWKTSGQINQAIAKASGFFIKNSSLYPMLTTLKNEDVIVRDGDKMALKSRLEGGAYVMTG